MLFRFFFPLFSSTGWYWRVCGFYTHPKTNQTKTPDQWKELNANCNWKETATTLVRQFSAVFSLLGLLNLSFPACPLTLCDTEIPTSRTTFFLTRRLEVLLSLLPVKIPCLHQPDLLFRGIKTLFSSCLIPIRIQGPKCTALQREVKLQSLNLIFDIAAPSLEHHRPGGLEVCSILVVWSNQSFGKLIWSLSPMALAHAVEA